MCELQGGSSIWASNPGVSVGIPGGGPKMMGWEPLLLSSYPSSFSRNPVVRVSSGWCARQRFGKESLELVPRPLFPPVCDFPGVVVAARVLGWQGCVPAAGSVTCVAVLVCV